jgi:hypothetical protein
MQKLNIEMRQVFQSLLDEQKKGRSISEKDDVSSSRNFMDVLLSIPQEDGTGHLPDYTIQTIVVVSLLLVHPFIISFALKKNSHFAQNQMDGWMEREREREREREIFTTCICRLKIDETLGS